MSQSTLFHRWLWLTILSLVSSGILFVAVPGEAGVLDASWLAPTTNTDGSPLTDLASYRVYYGPATAPCPGSTFLQVSSPTSSPVSGTTVTYRLSGLTTGTPYWISVSAVDTAGNESACSLGASAAAQAAFSVTPTGSTSFGNVNPGSSADRTFTVQNTRGGIVAGLVTTSAPFSIVSGTPFTLTGLGASQIVTVRFTPTTNTTSSANVNFIADGDSVSRLVTGTGTGTDTVAPTVTITSPTSAATYSTTTTPLTLGGTASDNNGVTQVTWSNNRGGSGTASGTTSWSASGIALQPGSNVLTVTARDNAGNTGTATLTVTSTDNTAPNVSITSPTSGPTYSASSSPLTIGGTASDNVAVTQVTWLNNRGGNGTATGTTSWSASGIALLSGLNVLTVTARDATGNTKTATLTVTGPVSFTDDPLATRSTAVKAQHITELRSAINTVRTARGLSAFTWTDPTLTARSTAVRAVHLIEMRTAVNQVYQAVGRMAPTYTDVAIGVGVIVIKATHLNELRTAVRGL